MELIEWTPEHYTAAGTWAMVLILAVTLIYARGQVKEAVRLRRDQRRPYVVPSIDVEQRLLFILSVENVGTSPARNVRIDFDEAPRSNLNEIERLRIFSEPIPTMPPRQKFRATWESALDVFSKEEPYPHPLSYRVNVTYEDHHGHVYGPEPYILDFRVYEGQAVGPKGMAELVIGIEQLLAEHKKWTDGISGILVSSQDATRQRRRLERPSHLRLARREYENSGWKGALSYWLHLWRRRHGIWFR